MEAAGNGSGGGGGSEAQLLISGIGSGDQPLVMSAEDAAQFLAQAGLQLADVTDSGEQVIINSASLEAGMEEVSQQQLEQVEEGDGSVANLNDFNDGTVLYIDPNDPQAAALLQQAGLTITEDGTVIGGIEQQQEDDDSQNQVITSDTPDDQLGSMMEATDASNSEVPQELFMHSEELETKEHLTLEAAEQQVSAEDGGDIESGLMHEDAVSQLSTETATTASITGGRMAPAQASPKKVVINSPLRDTKPAKPRQVEAVPSPPPAQQLQQQQMQGSQNQITVGPDQQQVFYTVSGEDGKTQQYMMLCPKDMDQNTLITTLVRQISADPSNKGKKTIRITQHKNTPAILQDSPMSTQSAPPARGGGGRGGGRGGSRSVSSTPKSSRQHVQQSLARSAVNNQSREINNRIGEILAATESSPLPPQRDLANIVDATETFESVVPSLSEEITEDVRVYVRCNYCDSFRSTLNSETWEAILNHILPVAKEEIQTTFYGDLEKHFLRSVRIQVNGRQMVRTRSASGSTETNIPQVEVILTHSLVCRKTRREFIVGAEPDAAFVANLAKHIRQMQPGANSHRANSLLCVFCNSPFTYEDYLRHIQPHLETILATLCCFSGAYCATTYENNVRATKSCQGCQEPEPADLRFLPCTRFSSEYQCLSKLQFAIECFRENFGENGFMRLNTNTLSKCTVCKNPQQVYCTLFHITSTIVNEADDSTRDVDTQLSVCVNCQKQFINIVIKEQNFDDRLKQFQLRNMEQLCSCLRVILGQARAISDGRKTLIYTVQEAGTSGATAGTPSAVHTVRLAEITDINPITRLIALAESEVVGSNVKAFYMCDLCMFTIDLTSILATPGSTQKNDMLVSIVLEHLVPHTESLLSVIASTAAYKTFNFKMEVRAKVSEGPNKQRKIILSLQKKFVSASSGLEIVLERDEERTLSQLRASVRAERNRSFVNIRTKAEGSTVLTASPSSQLVDVNKFIDKQKGKLSSLAQCGCNTHLLNAYTECRLCSKFCFPDFRLSGASQQIDLCENCVETVLTLCLPSDPEVLEAGEECLALRQEKVVGHRLVLANNVKKWLSLDGVNLIKKTVEEFNSSNANSIFSRLADCGPIFSEALKQHLQACLKTCHSDDDIVTAVTGFTVTEDFFRNSKYTGRDAETAAALASLQEQIDVPIREADSANRNIIIRRRLPERQIEVKILERRPPGQSKKTPIPIRIGPPLRGPARGGTKFSNGMVIDLGGQNRKSLVISPAGTIVSQQQQQQNKSFNDSSTAEESVSAIQSFIDENASPKKPTVPSVRITSTASGVVNIKAVSSSETISPVSAIRTQTITPRGRGRPPKAASTPMLRAEDVVGSVRNMKGVSMVTLTAGGIIKKVSMPTGKRKRDELESDDEGDSDDLYDDEDGEEENSVNNGKKPDGDREYRPPRKSTDNDNDSLNESSSSADLNRSKRQRKEKKIFDL